MTAWIGETFTSETGWSHLERLVDIGNRMAGSTGERQAAEATKEALGSVARNAHFQEFDVQGWRRDEANVETADRSETAIALPRSPNGRADGPLLDLDYGLPEDFEETDVEGKIVLVRSDVPEWYDRYIHRREKYFRAVRGGARAFIYQNHVEGCLPPTGSVDGSDGPIGEIPAVGVSKEVGSRLGRRDVEKSVTVSVSADIFEASSQNVHAELGPDTESEVLVTSHVDAHDIAEGARDNGSGTAMVVEMARALSIREDDLDTRVHFIAFGSEEVGLVGSHADADDRNLDDIKAVVNLDGVVENRTLSFATHGFAELETVVDRVADRFDHPVYVTPEYEPHSDHWPYVAWGVPGYHVASHSADAGRGWGHTAADTLDKLETRTFREQSIFLTDLVVEIGRDEFDVPHSGTAEIVDGLEAENEAAGLKITGDWPYGNPDT